MTEDEFFAHRRFMGLALEEARRSFEGEGGIPVGAVAVRDGEVIARGHNNRVQKGSPWPDFDLLGI